jgi:ABC-type glycerol-3-phosphate transport system permease component
MVGCSRVLPAALPDPGQDQRLRDGDCELQGPDHLQDGLLQLTAEAGNYVFITQDTLYSTHLCASLRYAAATTVLCLLIGYPFAYFMARARLRASSLRCSCW